MSRILWKSDYEVGVPAIDDQHRQLFELLDELAQPDAKIAISEALLELARYIDTHFAYEERLMQKHAYPRLGEHIAQHRGLSEQYRMLADAVPNDPQAVARLRMTVYAWFTRHILGDPMDRDLGRFLSKIGVFLR